jgi:hypothetical protein
MTGLTHENHAAFAAAPRHRGDAGQGAQRMIISFAQRLRGLAEQRGEDDPSDARQGSQDRHVALLGFLPRRIFLSAFGELVGEFVEPAMRQLDLLVHHKRDVTAAGHYAAIACEAAPLHFHGSSSSIFVLG